MTTTERDREKRIRFAGRVISSVAFPFLFALSMKSSQQ